MIFDKILEINKNLIKVKESNAVFNVSVGKKILFNIELTNSIIDKQNDKLKSFLSNSCEFDGFEYIINKDSAAYDEYMSFFNEDIECNLQMLTDIELNGLLLDLNTIELILQIMKK